MILLFLSLFSSHSWAEHTFKQIDTCYHWIDPKYLQDKIDYANDHQGQLYFWNDEVIYCWRTPLGAQSEWEPYGEVLLRVKFTPDVRIGHGMRINGDKYKDLQNLGFDVLYSNDNPFQEYTIAPSAIESWSIYRPEMVKEMKAELSYYNLEGAKEDDVYYAYENYDLKWINNFFTSVIQKHDRLSKTQGQIFGRKKERHFETNDQYPWQKYLKLFTDHPAPVGSH